MAANRQTLLARILISLAVMALVAPVPAAAQLSHTPEPPPPTGAQSDTSAEAPKLEELEHLAAPIAHYPDALVAQMLMASTYPLEVVQAALNATRATPSAS